MLPPPRLSPLRDEKKMRHSKASTRPVRGPSSSSLRRTEGDPNCVSPFGQDIPSGVNPDPAAAPHMKEINLAYELLSDPVRRVQYDRGRGVPAGSTDRPTQRKRKPARTDASPPFRSRPERSSCRRGWGPWPHVFAVLSGPLGLFVAIKVCLLLLSGVASLIPASARVETATPIAYDDLGQYERAIQDYDEVIRLNPQDAWAYNTGVLCTATLVSTSEPYRTTARPPDSSHRWRLFGSF